MPGARRTAVALALLVGIVAVLPGRANADSVDAQRQKADKIAQQLEQLSNDATTLADQFETTQANLAKLQDDIAASEERIATLEQQLGVVTTQVGELALQTFVSGDQAGGLGAMLIDASSITTAVERDQYTRLALSAGQSSTDELASTINDLNHERDRLAKKQQKAEQLSKDLATRQQEVEQKTADFETLKKQAEADLGQLVADATARRQAAEQAAARASRPKASTGSSRGGAAGGSAAAGAAAGGAAAGDAGGATPGADAPTPAPKPRAGQNVPPPSPGAGGAVAAALSQVGVPYRFATASPGVSFDCSGLTMWAWAQAGVQLPHYSRAQFESLPHVPADQAQPGDLIFYKNPVGHVGMYIGGGQMVHAPRTGETVMVVAVNWAKVRDGIVGRPG